MLGYYLDLALRSLKRNPVLTALMVLAIGLGIGASMTMLTVLHVMSGDPMPGRSSTLYAPHLDPLPLDYHKSPYGPDPSANFTWPDAMALVSARRAEHQAAMSGGRLLLRPDGPGLHPFYADGRYATSEFFAMFGVPFLQGDDWSAADDDARARVVVLTESLSRKLFGTTQSVGRAVRMGDASLQVVGVTADWKPRPLFYADASAKLFSDADLFYLPLSTAVDLKFDVSGNQSSWTEAEGGMKSPSLSWLQVWVQLKDAGQASAYRQFLVDYSARQKALGRFQRPPTQATLTPLPVWLGQRNLVPSDVRMQLWLAIGFLLVCMINIVALLLAKFLRRSGEVSVRRALGARSGDIFLQLGIESALIGVVGGLLGLLMAQLGLWSVRHRHDDYAHLAQMDGSMLAATFVLAIVASMQAFERAVAARSLDGVAGCMQPAVLGGTPGELKALGLHLVEGRDFHADEFVNGSVVPVAILSRALADKFYPGQEALGQSIVTGERKPIRVVGIVDTLVRPRLNTFGSNQFTMLWPQLPNDSVVTYLLRSAPSERQRVLHSAVDTLMRLDPERIIPADSVRTYTDMREAYFEHDLTMISLLIASALGLLFVTALGIAGLANFWVQQRTRTIGIRRAVGATRGDVLRYFQIENFLIVGAGIVLGLLLAVGLNLLLMARYEVPRLPLLYLPAGAAAMWLLGQLAVLNPALRAAALPPVVATRSV